MDSTYDLTLPSEEVEKRWVDESVGLLHAHQTSAARQPKTWQRYSYWLGHPNLPSRCLESPLRNGEIAAWLNPSSPLLLLANPSLFEGLVRLSNNLSYYGTPADFEELRELHPEAMAQIHPPPLMEVETF
jgi:hypothetical protein